jgi:hypothetical protein
MPSAIVTLQLVKEDHESGVAVVLINEKEKIDGNSIGSRDQTPTVHDGNTTFSERIRSCQIHSDGYAIGCRDSTKNGRLLASLQLPQPRHDLSAG